MPKLWTEIELDGGGRMNNYEVCKHVESVGSIAVYVNCKCKKAHMMKGKLVVSKKECESCTPVVPKEET